MSDSDNETDQAPKVKNRRPVENSFTQQRLKAYHPIITPKTVIPLLLITAIIFIPLGAGMLYGSNQVEDLTIEYTQCESQAPMNRFAEIPDDYYDFRFKEDISIKPQWKYTVNLSESDPEENGLCHLQFQIPNDIGSPVFFFYKLNNFYANHRRYVVSFSEDQINGKAASLDAIKNTVGANCEPLSVDSNGTRYYPCGLIANSLFNDTFTMPKGVNQTSIDYDMTQEGIAWESDKNRFKKTAYDPSEVVPPPNWIKRFPNGYSEENMPDISTWYEFQNWMHPAGLPTFSNLYYRNDDDKFLEGTYEVVVGLHWPVKPFNGNKYIYITTRSIIGGKNSFLGVTWIVVGGICFLLAILFLIVHLVAPRKSGDTSYLSWKKEKDI
ncbi:CDC50/LEM3 family protein [Ascoidea rubescens DSM 1968]|uniref:Lem3/Cdc50 n=1 Tax=Ascoidea rubescens DSM 1968 TaxID=1344418 RepID=A0A1D2VE77_9ASCO|nr:Lem3/Cdc50 [Ascoidea rubescens DSM 1968]ODV59767.1 Lem3/Cdc50 [Ascoidea rubescens DSM 1968]